MLRTELKVTLTGWRACSARTKAAVRMLPKKIRIGPKDGANAAKGKASFDRGDATYPVPDEAKTSAQNKIAAGIAAIADNPNASPEGARTMVELVAKDLVTAIQGAIRSGQVTGPTRSARWIATKGQNINMLGLTGAFVDSLDYDTGAQQFGPAAPVSFGPRTPRQEAGRVRRAARAAERRRAA